VSPQDSEEIKIREKKSWLR